MRETELLLCIHLVIYYTPKLYCTETSDSCRFLSRFGYLGISPFPYPFEYLSPSLCNLALKSQRCPLRLYPFFLENQRPWSWSIGFVPLQWNWKGGHWQFSALDYNRINSEGSLNHHVLLVCCQVVESSQISNLGPTIKSHPVIAEVKLP